MNTKERRHDIIQTVMEMGKVNVHHLASQYNISTVTIRTDLRYLDSHNLLIRCRGGAMACSEIAREHSIADKSIIRQAAKKRIAQRAAAEINDGEAIILDSGSTTAEVANYLSNFRRLVVMTNGINVACNLLKYKNFEVLMTGGILRQKSMSFYGKQAEDSIERYHFDKVILGADGVDFHSNITTHFELDATLNRTMCKVAKEIIVVSDSSKFNQAGIHKICSLKDITTFITDADIKDSYVLALEQSGVKLIIV